MCVQRSSVFVLFYYTSSEETKNFGVLDTRITTATDTKCTKIGVSRCSDPGLLGLGLAMVIYPYLVSMLQVDSPSRSSTQPTTGP